MHERSKYEVEIKMRTIKFRAWDEADETMIDFNTLVNWIDGHQILVRGLINHTNSLILMQYTGLKDKNGKEIYEGDIVRCYGGEYCQGYREHDETFIINNMLNDCFMMSESEYIEIQGNVYENPPLKAVI